MFGFSTAVADSATWLANPGTGDWNTAANWTQGGPPNGMADMATCEASTVSSLWVSGSNDTSGIIFNSGAGSIYTISVSSLEFFGSGITNNSGMTQTFVPYREIIFANSASAGSNTVLAMGGDFGDGAYTYFVDSSNAGNATLVANGSRQHQDQEQD